MRFLLLVSLIFSISTQASIGIKECNEKIRDKILKTANKKCSSHFEDFFWSESNVDSDIESQVAGAFSFRCSGGKRYIGIIKIKNLNQCNPVIPVVSHTSLVPLIK